MECGRQERVLGRVSHRKLRFSVNHRATATPPHLLNVQRANRVGAVRTPGR